VVEGERQRGTVHLVLRVLLKALEIWKFPWWVWLLIVLFGAGGGAFYKFYDFYKQRQAAEEHRKEQKEQYPLPLGVNTLFLPPFSSKLPSGLYVEIRNPRTEATRSLRLVLDAKSGRIESCEPNIGARGAEPQERISYSVVAFNVAELLPNERIEIYCLTTDLPELTVVVNERDETGKILTSTRSTARKSSSPSPTPSGPTFGDFLWFLFAVILLAGAGCVVAILIAVTRRLVKNVGR
jgi:hypothetical protein